jgi:anti-anti-sigma regulatory factor
LGLAQGAGWQPPQAQASISLGVLVVIGSLAFLLLLNGLSWRLMEESLVLAEAQTERLRVVHEDQQRLVVDLKVQSQRQAQLLAMLRELSTPVIPVSKEVVVLPLVGHVDMERLDIVRTALMDGIAHYRASVALLEMTGLRELDSEIVQGLLGLTDVARLLGAELVMVGVQPEMARLIVELDVDTSRLTARSDLESALAYALAQRQKGRPLSHSSHPVKLAETRV